MTAVRETSFLEDGPASKALAWHRMVLQWRGHGMTLPLGARVWKVQNEWPGTGLKVVRPTADCISNLLVRAPSGGRQFCTPAAWGIFIQVCLPNIEQPRAYSSLPATSSIAVVNVDTARNDLYASARDARAAARARDSADVFAGAGLDARLAAGGSARHSGHRKHGKPECRKA